MDECSDGYCLCLAKRLVLLFTGGGVKTIDVFCILALYLWGQGVVTELAPL